MEKEIGIVPDRDGFEVHVEGEEIIVTQYNGDLDCDVVVVHVSDAMALIDLLTEAYDEVTADRERAQPANENCNTPGPHNPDGTCCDQLPPVSVDACNDPACCPPPPFCADPCCINLRCANERMDRGPVDRSGEMR